MLKKTFLGLGAVGLLTGTLLFAGSPAPVAAGDRPTRTDPDRPYPRERGYWEFYGSYHDERKAYEVKRQLEKRGEWAQVREKGHRWIVEVYVPDHPRPRR